MRDLKEGLTNYLDELKRKQKKVREHEAECNALERRCKRKDQEVKVLLAPENWKGQRCETKLQKL